MLFSSADLTMLAMRRKGSCSRVGSRRKRNSRISCYKPALRQTSQHFPRLGAEQSNKPDEQLVQLRKVSDTGIEAIISTEVSWKKQKRRQQSQSLATPKSKEVSLRNSYQCGCPRS